MDTTDPDIVFDNNGFSNHYWDYQNNVLPKWPLFNGKANDIYNIAEKIKRDSVGKDFDCLIGLSGGLDSSYMVHKSVTEFGLRPLVFHVDAGWNTSQSVHNIEALVNKLNLELFTYVVNWDEMRDFQLSLFKAGVPHLDIPQDIAFISATYKFARQYSIKYILNGGNISTECVLMPLRYLYWPTDYRHVRDIRRQYGLTQLTTFPFSSIFYHKIIMPYLKRTKIIKPLNYLQFTKAQAIAELQTTYGWQSYPQKHFESRFTRFFEGHWLPNRFNYDMRRNQFSSLILTGQMSRDDALIQLDKPSLSQQEIINESSYIASKLEISLSELNQYYDMPLKYYWDYKNNSRLFALGSTILSKLANKRRYGSF